MGELPLATHRQLKRERVTASETSSGRLSNRADADVGGETVVLTVALYDCVGLLRPGTQLRSAATGRDGASDGLKLASGRGAACRWPVIVSAAAVSLPLNRARRFRGHIVGHAIDAIDLVDDPRRGLTKELVREGIVVGRHPVDRRDRAQGAGIIVGAPVAHDTDGSDRQQGDERLPDFVVEAVARGSGR